MLQLDEGNVFESQKLRTFDDEPEKLLEDEENEKLLKLYYRLVKVNAYCNIWYTLSLFQYINWYAILDYRLVIVS